MSDDITYVEFPVAFANGTETVAIRLKNIVTVRGTTPSGTTIITYNVGAESVSVFVEKNYEDVVAKIMEAWALT